NASFVRLLERDELYQKLEELQGLRSLKLERDTSSKKRLRMPASSSSLKMAVVSVCACHGGPKVRRLRYVDPLTTAQRVHSPTIARRDGS
ncbi:hypothetical protein, partial [Mesorhizobium sp. ES1-3]|uniref:hypothetical protein n=1 Tax=Mesorhizobium sp. ES1-3 TaxID=2876628 RepID=UPI001CCBBD63